MKKYSLRINKFQVGLLLIVLLLGCFFRFYNLADKVFWVDEISTVVRASGYTVKEVGESLVRQDVVDRDRFLLYQTIASDKTFFDSWNALVRSPEHAPLYFVLARFWMQLWGSSITVVRALSVCLSLLVFPALYWLCRELFARPFVGYIAVILFSVSPFYVTYAQEARPYSLWTVTILLMSASLLRAIRLNHRQSWLLYGCCLVLGLYTSLFSIYVAFFQGLYLLLVSLKNRFKIIKNYLLTVLLSLLAFSPWIFIIFNNIDLLHENTSWMRGNFNLIEIIAVYIGTTLLIFGDLPISQDSNPVQMAIVLIVIVAIVLASIKGNYLKKNPIAFGLLLLASSGFFLFSSNLDRVSLIGALVALCILCLSGYSLYYVIQTTSHERWLFIPCLILSLPLPLLIADIINQGQSSTAPRYLIPLQLGIQISVAYTIASKLKIKPKRKFWQLLTIGFLILGIFSCIRNSNISPFYQKGRNINNEAVAQIINRAESPLVVLEPDTAMDALSLAYSLSPQTKYKAIANSQNVTKYLTNFSPVFILKPSNELKQKLQQVEGINFARVYQSHLFSNDEIPFDLWSIKPVN